MLAEAAARSSGPSGISRSVWQESASRPKARRAKGVPAGTTFDTSSVSVRRAMSMRRSEPIRWSMLPEASRMISMALPDALPDAALSATVTVTNPGDVLPGVMRIGERASVAWDWPVE